VQRTPCSAYHQIPNKTISSSKHPITVSGFALDSSISHIAFFSANPCTTALQLLHPWFANQPRAHQGLHTCGTPHAHPGVSRKPHCVIGKQFTQKIPELVEKRKRGDGVQGEPNLSAKMVRGDFEEEEWMGLSLDTVMADFIHMDAAVDAGTAGAEATATVKVAYTDNAPQSVSSFTSQLSSSNPDSTLRGLKLHPMQNLVKKPEVQSGPLPPLVPLPFPLLCPHHTFLASLILASKFMQPMLFQQSLGQALEGTVSLMLHHPQVTSCHLALQTRCCSCRSSAQHHHMLMRRKVTAGSTSTPHHVWFFLSVICFARR
jgi:hypothetical protein